ncbi:transducin beta-like protein 3 isoform X3 [Lingula anatina]|uniref:Transducin beta-like protein 3 isoform X3 n=1 Tax=Lingula anatina TaxID=7574 RepID=A0A1S3HVG5_LINAN|nr:transducin beta-like protein 3 isoform X3 [Lingula anatina]|eukprot:XP_013390032.1 transducin beta-like protein 3 isoform X3 [Lingula anatina]
MSTKLKTSFAVDSRYNAFYTGGKVQFSKDGSFMLCSSGNQLQILDVQTGRIHSTIGQNEEEEEITSFILSPDDQTLIVAGRNLQLRQWEWKENKIERTWKAVHNAPVTCMAFDSTSTLVATGSADSTIKIWDIIKQYCTHNLRGHTGVVTGVAFHPDIERMQLISAAEDYKIRVWDLMKSSCIAVLDKHFSVITGLQFTEDGDTLYSCGRDSVVVVWDLHSFLCLKTIPVFEPVESVLLLSPNMDYPKLSVVAGEQHFITAGSKGILKVWNTSKAACVYTQEDSPVALAARSREVEESDQRSNITQAIHCPSNGAITVVTFDHYIIMFDLEGFEVKKQFAGYNDDILDIHFLGEQESHIAVATNSELIKVFELSTWNCQILHGHTDIVLSLDVYQKGNLLVSSSKDNSIRLWQIDGDTQKMSCVAVGQGHTHAVGAVAFSRLAPSFIVSGSQDCTIKLWSVPDNHCGNSVTNLHANMTEKAHEKDINSITVSPNDKLLATGSQDRTAKVWNASSLSLLGVCRGHRRGIWCVQFSPVDQCLATSSSDGTIKIWSLSDFTCVKTFEGHDTSVLKVIFLTRGMQLMSSGSDGLLKLWNIKNNECIKTLDEHTEKAWALTANKKGDIIVSGAADSSIIVWKDTTETEIEEAKAKEEDTIIKEQELSNLLQQKKYLKAIGLAITLEQPFRVLNIMKEILSQPTGQQDLADTVLKLRMDQADAVLRFSVQWNTNSKHCHVAQFVLSVVLKGYPPEELMKLPNFKATVEGLLPYTERHFQRMKRLQQQATFTDYTWQCMKLGQSDRVKDNEASHSATNMETENFVGKTQDPKDGASQEMVDETDDLGERIRKAVQQRLKELDQISEKQSGGKTSESEHIEVDKGNGENDGENVITNEKTNLKAKKKNKNKKSDLTDLQRDQEEETSPAEKVTTRLEHAKKKKTKKGFKTPDSMNKRKVHSKENGITETNRSSKRRKSSAK